MCLMAFAKQSWEEAAIPLKDSDWDIIYSMEKVKAEFDKTRRNKRINVDAKVGYNSYFDNYRVKHLPYNPFTILSIF